MLHTARSLRTELQKGTRQIKDSIAEKTTERWQRKAVHEQFPRNLDEKLVENEHSYL
jgi:ubiquinone biosynthesis protein UbiJ